MNSNPLLLILENAGNTLLLLLPYYAAGVLSGELLKLTSWTRIVHRAVRNHPAVSIPAAVVLGIVSPLCTYGTLPVMVRLYGAGMPAAVAAAFLASSSLMNPQLFVMTWGGLGLPMALARLVSVFLFGIAVGFIMIRIPEKWIMNPGLEPVKSPENGDYFPAKKTDIKTFLLNLLENFQYTGFYLVLGILAGSAVEILAPADWIQAVFQKNALVSVLAASIMGIPLYSCGGGVIPLIRSLMEKGMSGGAALAFFIVGPATRVTPLVALGSLFRVRFIFIYVFLLILFAIGCGMIYR